jgi:hypothetical protein
MLSQQTLKDELQTSRAEIPQCNSQQTPKESITRHWCKNWCKNLLKTSASRHLRIYCKALVQTAPQILSQQTRTEALTLVETVHHLDKKNG